MWFSRKSEPAQKMTLYEELTASADREYGMWKKSARGYASYSRVFQTLIITSAVLVGVGEAQQVRVLDPVLGRFSEPIRALLPFFVAFFTALDVWLRPTDKWKGFLIDRDDMDKLRMRIRDTDPEDKVRLNELLCEFTALRQRHNHHNVF